MRYNLRFSEFIGRELFQQGASILPRELDQFARLVAREPGKLFRKITNERCI
jgi:hypothetical protein